MVVDVQVNMRHKFQQSLVLHSVHQQSGGYSSCYTQTGTHGVVVQNTVEIPQLQFLDLVVVPVSCNDKCWYRQCRKLWNCRRWQLLWCCGRHCDHTARSSRPAPYVSCAIQSDRVPDIPVRLTVQFLNKVADMVVCDSCCVHRQGRRHPWFRTVEVPQIQSSTELNDDFETGLAHFFGLSRKVLSPGLRGFFEPWTMKSSSSSRATQGGGVAGSLTPR